MQFLKVENQILRAKLPRRITVIPRERQRLVKFGQVLGSAIRDLITIVSLRTFLRWLHDDNPARKKSTRQPGRPKTKAAIRDLILKLACENAWGYTRILGELRKLGVGKVSRSTVVNLLKAHGLDSGPKRGEGTWDDFLRRHAATLWATDFFSQKVFTLGGFVNVFVLFFIHLGSRRVYLAGLTAHPDRQWVAQQARNVSMFFADEPVKPKYLIRAHDSKFAREFDDLLKSDGMETVKVGPRAPNMSAHAERWVQAVKHECLDHFLIFGEAHLRHLLSEYLAHYHGERPHQGLGNQPLTGAPPPAPAEPLTLGAIVCAERLGGLLKHYTRRAD
jgi:putative transposase